MLGTKKLIDVGQLLDVELGVCQLLAGPGASVVGYDDERREERGQAKRKKGRSESAEGKDQQRARKGERENEREGGRQELVANVTIVQLCQFRFPQAVSMPPPPSSSSPQGL